MLVSSGASGETSEKGVNDSGIFEQYSTGAYFNVP